MAMIYAKYWTMLRAPLNRPSPNSSTRNWLAPLTPATTPRIEKIPAPIIPPTPILTAAGNPKPLGAGVEAPAARRRTLLILPHSLDLDRPQGVHSLLRTCP